MKKTFSCYLVLLGLILLQRVEAQAPTAARPPTTTAEQKQPVEDPLGRSTPHGTVVGLSTAGRQDNLDRAAEYLDSGLKSPERRELARKLWAVLDRKLLTSLDSISNTPDGALDDGLTNREISTELGVSEHTIKNHLFRIYEKLGISSRVELILYAVSERDKNFK